jgi:hypothetical protein
LTKCIALSTKAEFQYDPTIDDVKKFIQKRDKKKVTEKDLNKLTDEDIETIKTALRDEESKRLWRFKQTAGDASETGLIKFTQPIIDITKLRDTH